MNSNGDIQGYNLFAYCSNNPVMGFDPTGNWDWELFGKVVLTGVVVAACLTGVGAIAATAAAATGAAVSTAVAVSVASAGISTTISAIDGAICAEQSGGEWYDGAMAGAIGGSIGSLVSSATSPFSGADSALRINTAGRTAGSIAYNMAYEFFTPGSTSATTATACVTDVIMDATFAPLNYYYTGKILNPYMRTSLAGIIDGAIDVYQTNTFFAQ